MSKRLTASVLSALAIAAPTHAEESTGLPITVTATRFKQNTASATSPLTIITKDQIQRHGWTTLEEILRNQPSLETSSNGGKGQQSSVFMRGFNSEHSLVLVDGMRLGRSSMGSADLSTVPLSQVERIEIIRGARAAIYGSDAVAGVINIITRSENSDHAAQINMNTGSSGYSNIDGSVKGNVTGQDHLKGGAAYNRESGYNVHPSSANEGDEHGYWNKSAQTNYEHQFNDGWALFTSGRWMQKQNAYDSYGSYKNQYTEDQAYQTSLEHQSDKWQSNWNIQYVDTNYLSGYGKNEAKDDATYKNYNDQTSLGWFNQYNLSEGWSLGGGVDWRESRLKDGSESSGTELDGQLHNTGAYSLVQYEQNAWTWELSGRVDNNSGYGTHETWRTGAAWSFIPDYRLITNFSTAFRAPTLLNLYSPWGNPDLKAEKAKGGEIGVEGNTGPFQWKVTAYRSLVTDMIEYDDVRYNYYNIGAARLQGIETEIGFVTGIIKHHLSADFADPTDATTDKALTRRAKNTYKWQAETSWDKWDAAASWVYKNHRADINYDVYPYENVVLSSYSLWDISVGYHLLPQLRIGGRIDNLFDKDYQTAYGYETPSRSYYLNFAYQM